ncbi:hypothetical protein HHI36_017388 [Cryptolaemus montrouzieri]|uniref:Uncharacterized protein n=1 Tax=Cryptolaemus montrouzieri TaxID=559131 RepID=A0ABD2NN46_9CUCU
MTNILLEDPQTSSNALGTSKEVPVSSSDLTEAGSSSTNCDSEQSNNMDTQGPSEASKQSTFEKNINSPKPLPNLDPDVVQVIHNLSPLPDAAKKRSLSRKRKCEKSEIVTSSRYKILVEEKANKKNVNSNEREGKQTKE